MNFRGASQRAWLRLAAAVLLVAAAAGLRAGLLGALGTREVYVTFYPAVMLAALYGGLSAGLLATGLSSVAASWWIEPVHKLGIQNPADWLAFAVFIASCMMISAICEAMHRAQARASKATEMARIADERRRAEQALRQSEAKYRFISENTADMIWLFDLDAGQYTYINPAVNRLLGFSPEEVVGQPMERVLAPESLKLVRERLPARIRVLEAGDESVRVQTHEVDQLNKSGLLVPAEVVTTLLQNESGRVKRIIGVARDITERRRAEEKQRESEQRYRSLFENMLNGFAYCRMLYDQDRPKDFIYVAVNRAFESLTGLKDVSGKKVSEVIPHIQESDQEIFKIYGRVASTGIPERFEIFVKALAEWFAVSVYSPKKEHFVAIFDVITKRKQAEEALRESEGRLRLALSASKMGVWEWNIRTNDVFWSPESCEIAGAESPRTTFDSFAKSLHPEDAPRVRSSIERAIATGSVYEAEFRFIRPDGKVIWLSNLGHPDYDEAGKPFRMVGIARDITELKQAEQALRQSEERYRALVENAAEAIGVVQGGMLRFVNPKAEIVSGYSRDELTSRPFVEFIHPEDRPRVMVNHQHRLKGEPTLDDLDFRIVRKDGTVRSLQAKATNIIWNGTPATLTLFTDITGHLHAEEEQAKLKSQLFQAQKMESVGRLAGGVAHDFNNMLCVIIGNAEAALDRVDPADPLRRDLEEIQKAGQRSANLTRQLLAFARRQTASPKVLDLNDTIEGMLKMLRRLIGEDIHLTWNPGHALWNVKMDPSQIDQILANLAVNARDAISGVGQVSIETANVGLDSSYCSQHAGSIPGEYVMLTLSDNGAGMSKDVLEHIFEPFFTTKEVGRGTGLGLATVYGIVKQNNGFIDVLSEPGKGTSFKIYAPRCETQVQNSSGAETRKIRGGTETILLVEDSQPLLELGRKLLEKLGYKILAVSTPQQAIDHARNTAGDIHLLITDVVMPDMNGRDLMERISEIRPGLKCLFMSGYTTDVIARRGVLEEGIPFIQKPFSKEELAAKIRQMLD